MSKEIPLRITRISKHNLMLLLWQFCYLCHVDATSLVVHAVLSFSRTCLTDWQNFIHFTLRTQQSSVEALNYSKIVNVISLKCTKKNNKHNMPSWNVALTCMILVLLDRAGHFEIPLRLMGHPVPAAQTGGGRAVSTAARRPLLPRVCRLHLPVVSVHSVTNV